MIHLDSMTVLRCTYCTYFVYFIDCINPQVTKIKFSFEELFINQIEPINQQNLLILTKIIITTDKKQWLLLSLLKTPCLTITSQAFI